MDLPDAEGHTQFLSHRHRRQYRYHSQSWHCPATYSKWKESTQTSSDVGGSGAPNSSWYRCLAELYSQKLGEWPASYFHTSPDGHLSVHAPGVVALPALGVSAKNLGQSHRAQCLLNRLLFLQLLVVVHSFSIKWRMAAKILHIKIVKTPGSAHLTHAGTKARFNIGCKGIAGPSVERFWSSWLGSIYLPNLEL